MANFDSNQWYSIYTDKNKNETFLGGALEDHVNQIGQSGAVFFSTNNPAQTLQQWQFYRVDANFYVLRSKGAGADGFLSTFYSKGLMPPSDTSLNMRRGNASDDSAYWQISPWSDGTFFLFNKANQSSYHLEEAENSNLVYMTNNITSNAPGQRFSFTPISAIDDEQFSTFQLRSSTSVTTTATTTSPITTSSITTTATTATATTSTSTTSTTSTAPSSSSSPTNNSDNGLSTGAKVGIGLGVSIPVLILLILGAYLYRRRRPHRTFKNDVYADGTAPIPTRKMSQIQSVIYEASGTPRAELHHDVRPAELPSENS